MFVQFKANIVRLAAEKTPAGAYAIRFSVSIPDEAAASCIATVANTAEGLQMVCEVEALAGN